MMRTAPFQVGDAELELRRWLTGIDNRTPLGLRRRRGEGVSRARRCVAQTKKGQRTPMPERSERLGWWQRKDRSGRLFGVALTR
jgi:hypothetical protein